MCVDHFPIESATGWRHYQMPVTWNSKIRTLKIEKIETEPNQFRIINEFENECDASITATSSHRNERKIIFSISVEDNFIRKLCFIHYWCASFKCTFTIEDPLSSRKKNKVDCWEGGELYFGSEETFCWEHISQKQQVIAKSSADPSDNTGGSAALFQTHLTGQSANSR